MDFLESEMSISSVSHLMRVAGIPQSRGFHDQKIYPDKEWQNLFKTACTMQGISPEIVETGFALYFFRFIREHQIKIYRAFLNSKSFIESLPAIHNEIVGKRKKSKNNPCDFNKLRVEPLDSEENAVVIRYCSPNHLCRFLGILAREVIHFYGDEARVEHMHCCMKRGAPECEIHIYWETLR